MDGGWQLRNRKLDGKEASLTAPQQLTQWRRAAGDALLALVDDCDAGAPAFVPLGVGDATEETLAQPIEIVAGRIVVRLPGTASAARIAEVAAALGTRF